MQVLSGTGQKCEAVIWLSLYNYVYANPSDLCQDLLPWSQVYRWGLLAPPPAPVRFLIAHINILVKDIFY